MKAILAQDGRAALADVPVPAIGEGEVLLKVEVCGLCGTDVMKLDTRAKNAILGHELCGRVAEAGPGARFSVGERIVVSHHVPCLACHYCRKGQESMCRQFKTSNIEPGGFAELVRVPAAHVEHAAFRVPDGLDPVAASQTEPLACVLRAVKRLGIAKGDSVGLIGLGAIGQLTGQLLKRLGARAVGVDLDVKRAQLFSAWGQGVTDADGFAYAGKGISEGRGYDVIIVTAGSPELVSRATTWLRDGGALGVFASFHPDPVAKLDLNQVYHRELSILSSYSPTLADLREAFDLIASRTVDPLKLAPQAFRLEAFDEAVKAVKTRHALKSVLVPA